MTNWNSRRRWVQTARTAGYKGWALRYSRSGCVASGPNGEQFTKAAPAHAIKEIDARLRAALLVQPELFPATK